MKVLIIGDVVGEPGRTTLFKYLEKRRQNYDFIIVNGENAAAGFGITPKIANQFFQYGVDVITLGNHTYDRKEIYSYLDETERIIRPNNFHPTAPGHGYTVVEKNGLKVGVINIQGKTFMQLIECPFANIDKIAPKLKSEVDILIVDFHAEATSEKQAMGWNLAGIASVVFGTHTHTQTADEKILYDKTAYITDAGMTGGHDGVLGMNKRESIKKLKDGLPGRFIPCEEGLRINGIEVVIDDKTHWATSIKRVNMGYNEI